MPDATQPISTSSTASNPPTRVRCTHCRQDVPRGLIIPNREFQFCCHGCQSAFEIIHSCGLDRYYQLLHSQSSSPTPPRSKPTRSYAEFDDNTFRSLYVQTLPVPDAPLHSCELILQGVHCGACLWLIERLPRLLPGVIEARVNLRRALVKITWDDTKVKLSAIGKALDSIGYPPSPARDAKARQLQLAEDRRQLVRIGIAGACAGNVMLLAICLYAGLFHGMERWTEQYFRWLSLGITAISILWPGSVFFKSAWAAIKTHTPHLDIPITLALAAGSLWSFYTTIRGSGEIYFDSLSVLVFALLAGRFIQMRQQRRAADSVELLFALTPRSARLVDPDTDQISEVPIEALKIGQVVEVRAGDSIPVDGHVVTGSSAIDLSLLTGESRPVKVHPGQPVAAGAANISSTIRVCVSAVGELSRIGKLMNLVEESSQRKAPIVRIADRLSGAFVLGMILLGIATFLFWLTIDPSRAVDQGVALLVVTCPCALGLATPLALTVALGKAARHGMLIKGGDAVERLSSPGTLYLDKTGTITLGRMSVVRWIGDVSIKPLVAALESHSSHPIAQAICRDLPSDDALHVTNVQQTLGSGIQGFVNDANILIGSPDFVLRDCISDPTLLAASTSIADQGHTPVCVGLNGRLVAVIGLGDDIRADAKITLDKLRSLDWRIIILSGDHQTVVSRVATELGIDDARGSLSPEDKLAVIQRAVQSKSIPHRNPVVFVGDGVNDAAGLAAADVGIAVHGGAEASLAAADIYLSNEGLWPILDLLTSSRRTMGVIRRNLAASFVYNLLAVFAVFAGWVTPLFAAIIMPASSITVLALSYRSRTFDSKTPRPADPSSQKPPKSTLPRSGNMSKSLVSTVGGNS